MKHIMQKIKDNKATILKLLSMLSILVLISLITMVILFATGVLKYEDGFEFDSHLFDSFKDKWYSLPTFIAIQTMLTMLLCAIPGVAMAFVMLSQTAIYTDDAMMAFVLSYSCVLISSTVLYILGRLGGYKLCEKMLGKEDCDKSLELLRTRGTTYFPIMMLFPIFPDDALVMLAGTTKMRLGWFIPSIIICRGIGVATIIFGLSIIPFDTFTTYDWIILITVAFFWVKEIFMIANKLDRHFAKKRREMLEKQNNFVEQTLEESMNIEV